MGIVIAPVASPWLSAVGTFMLVLAAGGCGGSAQPGASAGSSTRTATEEPDEATPGAPGVAGAWSGTVTYHAVINDSSDETTTSGEGLFAVTIRVQSETQLDVTDVFTVTGSDGDDMEFGVVEVDLTGLVEINGTALERIVTTSDKHNALGCHYLAEIGSEVNGPWAESVIGAGTIGFNDDGSYTITMGAGGDPVTGEMPDLKLPKRLWETFTILEGAARDCPPPGTSEVTDTEGPILGFASSLGGDVGGNLDPANPGSVVEGSVAYETTSPDATVTVTWHLVHDGRINLPHD